jgi:hypothetical protein
MTVSGLHGRPDQREITMPMHDLACEFSEIEGHAPAPRPAVSLPAVISALEQFR